MSGLPVPHALFVADAFVNRSRYVSPIINSVARICNIQIFEWLVSRWIFPGRET